MSWFGAIKKTEDPREERRKQLERERSQRKEARIQRQQQLQAALLAQKEADQACSDLLSLDPDILAGDDVQLNDSEVEELLAEDKMAEDFDTENGADGDKALDKMGSVKCEFSKDDIEFWFTELETQLEVIDVKSQWTKRIALQRFLPADVKQEIKALLIIPKASAGTDIYKRIKTELLDLYGQKPGDAYVRAKNRVMTGKPSQLGKALINDICTCPVKLQSGCCAKIIWGMYREAIPIVIRNHIAEMEFNKDTYKQIFQKSDQIFDSNQSSNPVKGAAVAAVSSSQEPEVAAVRPPKANRGGRGAYRGGGRGGGRGGASSTTSSSTPSSPSSAQPAASSAGQSQSRGQRHATAKGDSEKLCKIHFKWGENGSYCAAPWKCPMKNVYKAPQ